MIFISTESESELDHGDVYGFVSSAAFSKGDHVRLVHVQEGQKLEATVFGVHGNEISIVLEGCEQPLLFTVHPEDLELRFKRERCSPAPDWRELADIRGLVKLLLDESEEDRPRGSFKSQPVLLRAGPGTGKTWSLQQMYYLLAKGLQQRDANEQRARAATPVIPIVFYVQRLVRLMRKQKCAPGMGLLFTYIRDVYGNSKRATMLQQAIRLKGAILLIDGVDEAAGLRQTIEDLVHLHLVPQGHKVVVTSRPEGVRLPLYRKHFVVLNLKPLTDEQQRQMIQGQLKGNDFFEHLMAFMRIRRGHDELYVRTAFMDDDERRRIESFEVPNLFLIQDGSMAEDGSWIAAFDPEQRQERAGGGDFVGVLAHDAQPMSVYLNTLQNVLDSKVIQRLDKLILALDAGGKDNRAFHEHFHRVATILEITPESSEWKTAKRLCLLSRKLRQQALAGEKVQAMNGGEHSDDQDAALPSRLWPRIARRTDAIYVVAERMKPIFKAFVKHSVRAIGGHVRIHGVDELDGIDDDEVSWIKFGKLKDPVRIHEKAWDDYAGRFGDDVIPEACVVDILRCSVILPSASMVIKFTDSLAGDSMFLYDEGPEPAHFRCTLIRGKNKFRKVDPTHFRNILCNLRIESVGDVGERESCFFEVQVHHKVILDFNQNEDKSAHTHCEF